MHELEPDSVNSLVRVRSAGIKPSFNIFDSRLDADQMLDRSEWPR